MTANEVTRAAMYLLAKQQRIDTRNVRQVEQEWNRWHRVVHTSLRQQVRLVHRAIAWATRPSSEGAK